MAFSSNSEVSYSEGENLMDPDPYHAGNSSLIAPSANESSAFAPMFQHVGNIVNLLTGPTLVVVPYAFRSAGVIGGILLLLAVVLLQYYSWSLLTESSHMAGLFSYSELCLHYAGGRANGVWAAILSRIVDLFIFLFGLGLLIGHCIILRDLFPPLVRYWSHFTSAPFPVYLTKEFLTAGFVVLSVVPLNLFSNKISRVFLSSWIAIVIIVFTSVVEIYALAAKKGLEIVPSGPVALFVSSSSNFVAFALFSLCFTSQIIFFPILKTVKTKREHTKLTLTSFLVTFGLYLLFGIVGYCTFRSGTPQNVLTGYQTAFPLTQALKCAYVLNVVFNWPVIAVPTREAFHAILLGRQVERPIVLSLQEEPRRSVSSWKQKLVFTVETLLIVAIALALSLISRDVVSIFGITGAFCCAMLSFVIPAVFYLNSWGCFVNWSHFWLKTVPAVALLLIGIVFFGTGLYAVIEDTFIMI